MLAVLTLAGCSIAPTQSSPGPPPNDPPGAADQGAFSPFARLTYATAWATESRPALVEFKHWTQRYTQADAKARPALVTHGVALAKIRREALAKLIQSAPSDALAATVPAAVRAQLPPEVLAQLETRVSGRGNFLPVALELPPGKAGPDRRIHVELAGQNYEAFVSVRRAGEPGKYNIPLHGIALDGRLALHDSPLRVAEPGELPLVVRSAGSSKILSVKPAGPDGETSADDGRKFVLAEYAGEILAFPSAAAVGHLEQALIRAERLRGPFTPRIDLPPGGLPGTGGIYSDFGDPGWTTGRKKVLLIRVDYSDRPGEPWALAEVNRLLTTYAVPFYHDMSYGATDLDITVTPQVYRMPNTAAGYAALPAPRLDDPAWVVHADARAAAAADYTLSDFDRVGVLSPAIFTFFGVTQIGTERFFVSPVFGAFSTKLFTHEIGHTYGLSHANLWQVTDGNPESHGGTVLAYGDPFDDMADDYAGDMLPHYHVHPWAKHVMGWLPDSAITTVRSTGLYPLYHFDDATADLTRPLAIRVCRDGMREYWIGYRHNLTGYPALDQGAYVFWGYNPQYSLASHLLDITTPGVSALDAPMQPHGWLVDPLHHVDLGLFQHTGTGADERIDMKIAVSPSPGYLLFWGFGTSGSGIPGAPDIDGGVVDIAAGPGHALAVRRDGTVVAWGSPDTYGEATVPATVRNVAAAAAGAQHSLALKRDGTVTGWGDNSMGQLDVPAGLRNVTALAAGGYRSVALRTDSTVVQWGATAADGYPMPAGLRNVTALAVGNYFVLALRTDGTVIGWGDNIRTAVATSGTLDIPAGLDNVVAIAANGYHCLALKRDGTVVAWGSNTFGESDVPVGLVNVVTIGAGLNHSLARLADGTLVAWGENNSFACDVPAGAPYIRKLAGGNGYSLGLTGP